MSCEMTGMKTRLAEHRQRLGMSQEEMAERLNSSVSQLSRWETGKSNIPSGKLLEVAAAYEVHVADIFDYGDGAVELSLDTLTEMVANAQAEMAFGTSFADVPRVLASSLWDQLKVIETAGGVRLAKDREAGDPDVDVLGRRKRRYKFKKNSENSSGD